MPVILLERIPLPSLRAYTGFSVILLACALFYAHQLVLTAESEGLEIPVMDSTTTDEAGIEIHYMNVSLPYDSYVWNMMYVMTAEAWCVWVLKADDGHDANTVVNTAYCCLILLGKMVQKVIFGELRVSEQQHLKDKFWNFLFYKFIFVFGVMNVQTMEEVVLWVAWFSILGFFHLLTQLSKDRFEYVSFSPTTPRIVHVKLLSLLCVIVVSCCGLMAVCVMAGLQMGITIFSFMAAECVLLAVRTLQVVMRYSLHLIDMNLEGVWENRSTYVYFTELGFELAALSIDFGHHLHMLLWGNIFLSMASLVICMQLRYLFYEFQRRIKRHKNYRRVVRNMEQRFSMATAEELSTNNDNCAVCWERLETARKLPCGHLFHNSCLRSWLEQDTSCPTCRQSLSDRPERDPNGNEAPGRVPDENDQPPNPAAGNLMTNHFFHFDGSRYVSWLPSFSVEVTHTNMLANNRQNAAQTSQLDNLARQVLQVFPHMPLSVVMDDLRITRSVDFTIENILEGRLTAPPPGTLMRSALGDDNRDSDDSDSFQSPVQATEASAPRSEWSDGPDEEYFQVPTERGDNNESPSLECSQETRSELPSQFGGRFSKSADERESMLEDRKNTMLEQARRRFLAKDEPQSSTSDTDPGISTFTPEALYMPTQPLPIPAMHLPHNLPHTDSDMRHRRELAYQAAARRMGQGPEDT